VWEEDLLEEEEVVDSFWGICWFCFGVVVVIVLAC
jgi:hypothetical protein